MEHTQRLFLGLAHARPTERNDDEEIRGAVGAYTNAVALADDEEAFVERVRIELDHMDFELVEIDDVRPFDQALEDGMLARSLLELANDAAHENTTRFDTFHLYEEHGDDDDGEEPDEEHTPRDVLELALLHGGLVGLRRAAVPAEHMEGFVVAIGSEWVLLHKASDHVFLDGHALVPVDEVFDAWLVPAESTVVERALRLQGAAPQALPNLPLGSARDALQYLDERSPLVTVFVERDAPDVCYIGRVARFADESFILEPITPGARWEGEETLRYDALTRIDVGGKYEQALALVAASDAG